MSRRTALWASGAATVVVFLVLARLDGRMVDTGGPGIIDFELAGSETEAARILGAWGSAGRDAARASLWIDFLFLAAYATFGTLVAVALRDATTRPWLRAVARSAVAAMPLAAACDVVENVFLLLVLGEHGPSSAPALAEAFARAKFTLVIAALAVGLVLAGVTLVTRRRGS